MGDLMEFKNNSVYLLSNPYEGCFLAANIQNKVVSIEITSFDIYDADENDIEYWISRYDIEECCEEISNLIIKQLETNKH